jgi:putative oxidoreductase
MEHGYAKIMPGPESFTTILHALGMPAPGLLAWATILVELFAAWLFSWVPSYRSLAYRWPIVLFVAIFTVHLPNGFSSIKLLSVDAAGAHFGQPGYETDLLYFAGLLALVLGGSGPLAFDNIFLRRTSKAMKTKSVLSGCIMALLAVASGAAYAQMKTTENSRCPESRTRCRRRGQLAGSRRLSHRLSVFGQLGSGSRPRPGFEGDPCRLRVAGHDRCLSQRWTVPGWVRARERGL